MNKQRVKLFEHRAQFRRDALWQKNRDARADAQELTCRIARSRL